MKPVLIDLDRLGQGSAPTRITSENQRHAQDLPAAVTVSCWQFTAAERQAVARGADLYLFVQTHGLPLQPVSLVIGPERGELVELAPPEVLV